MLRLVQPSPGSDRELLRSHRGPDPLKSLVEACCHGQPGAARTLMVAVGPHLLGVVRGALGPNHPDVEDVLQEAMVGLYRALPSFRGDSTVIHFACRIAVQVALNARRRLRYRKRYTPNWDFEELERIGSDVLSPAEETAAARRRELLRVLLDELPESQAEVLALHIMAGHSVEETAGATATPVNTVRSRLRAALTHLRQRVMGDRGVHEALRREP